MDDSSRERKLSDRLVSLVDIVFGVVFGLSIPTVFGSNTTLTLPKDISEIINLSNVALFVAYLAIIFSWVGYHKAMEKYPFRIGLGGTRRFFMDLVIVFLYAILIYSRVTMQLYLAVFTAIFFLYILWDLTLDREYGSRIATPRITLKYLSLFLAIFLIYLYIDATNEMDGIFLAVVFILNSGFRYEKGTWRHS